MGTERRLVSMWARKLTGLSCNFFWFTARKFMKVPWSPASVCRDDQYPSTCPGWPSYWIIHSILRKQHVPDVLCFRYSLVFHLASYHGYSMPSILFSIFSGHIPFHRNFCNLCRLSPALGMIHNDYSCIQLSMQKPISLGHIFMNFVGLLVHCTIAPSLHPPKKDTPIYPSTKGQGHLSSVLWSE